MSKLTDRAEANVTECKSNEAASSGGEVQHPPPDAVNLRKKIWGATTAMKWIRKSQGKSVDERLEKRTLRSVAKRVNKQIKAMAIVKRWAHMTSLGQFSKDEEHLSFIREATGNASTDIPAPIQHCIREETLSILQDTLKQYRVELGATHPLTVEMQEKICGMREKVQSCVPKDGRKANFLKRFSTVFLGGEQDTNSE